MYIMYYLKYGLILLDSWPGVDSAKLCNALVALSCASLCFQFLDAAAVFHDLDALLTNMETSIGVLSSVFKIVTFRMQSGSTKKMVKMSIEEHVEKNAANPNSKTDKSKSNNENAVKLILQILFVSYFVLGLSYPAVSLVSYALGSSEERVFVMPSMYFIPSPRESPAFELLWISLLDNLSFLEQRWLYSVRAKRLEFTSVRGGLFRTFATLLTDNPTTMMDSFSDSLSMILIILKFMILWNKRSIAQYTNVGSLQSDKIAMKMYETIWYKTSIKEIHAVAFIIKRSQKPLMLSVAKSAELSMTTFTQICYIRQLSTSLLLHKIRNIPQELALCKFVDNIAAAAGAYNNHYRSVNVELNKNNCRCVCQLDCFPASRMKCQCDCRSIARTRTARSREKTISDTRALSVLLRVISGKRYVLRARKSVGLISARAGRAIRSNLPHAAAGQDLILETSQRSPSTRAALRRITSYYPTIRLRDFIILLTTRAAYARPEKAIFNDLKRARKTNLVYALPRIHGTFVDFWLNLFHRDAAYLAD
ncbi:unnamed protein product [Trichogramma brassicae]|uniref:Odorant receptor n=1 Tax=Trichogramma brassicae TaxID=86971 RepID=A0A6H5IY15_9HYME|nr:unnamed protein product [Trichogramma brassicae]